MLCIQCRRMACDDVPKDRKQHFLRGRSIFLEREAFILAAALLNEENQHIVGKTDGLGSHRILLNEENQHIVGGKGSCCPLLNEEKLHLVGKTDGLGSH